MDITEVLGLVFRHAALGHEYGTIRRATNPAAFRNGARVIAEDESGNAFVARPNGCIAFWDHETGELTDLAASWEVFVEGCAPAQTVQLEPGQVKSVWIDPTLARELGLDVPPDGWKKRSDQ